MSENKLRPLELFRPPGAASVSGAVDSARQLTRHLLPFPGAAAIEPLQALWKPAASGDAPTSSVAPAAIHQAASGIVSQAASILDEEMARGVLSARSSAAPTAIPGLDPGGAPMMRQLHDFVDQLAAAWPSMQQMWGPAARPSADRAPDDSLAELRPATRPRRGESAMVTMVLSNDENRAVRLAPVLSDFVGSSGDRISSRDVAVTPSEVRLEPGSQRELRMTIPIPAGSASTRYTGLVVVTGAEGVRAVVTVEVA